MKLILVFVSLLAAVSANSKRWSSSFGSSFGSFGSQPYRPSSSSGSQSYRPSSFGSQSYRPSSSGSQSYRPSSSGSSSSSSSGTCGKSSVTSPFVNGGVIKEAGFQGIVGGKKASPGMYPYQALLKIKGRDEYGRPGTFKCGGSILSNEWILSAAHCFGNSRPGDQHEVYLGSFDHSGGYDGKMCKVVQLIEHSKYNPSNEGLENDIALLKIDCGRDFKFTNTIQPVCLADRTADLKSRTGAQVIVSGWGNTYEGSKQRVNFLNHVVVAVSDHKSCERIYARSAARPGWLCAAARGKDSCQGDSGGPLVNYENGRYVQYGVVSFGEGCARTGYPGVYTDVPYYRDWIKQYTGL